jgi:hypothetical protein
MRAREYLEHLQIKQTGREAASATYDERIRLGLLDDLKQLNGRDRDLLERHLRTHDAFKAKFEKRAPTRYQSLQDYVRLAEAKKRIDVLIRQVGEYTPIDNIVFGSIEAKELNAVSGFFRDSNEYLVVFNRGLLMALLAISNLVICPLTMKAGDLDEPIDTIDANIVARLLPRFAHVLDRVSSGGTPGPDVTIPVLAFPEKEMRWTFLEDAAIEFVLAHEYAHVLLGHLAAPARMTVDEDKGGWGCEYQADSLALDFLVQSWAARDPGNPLFIAFALQGVWLLFHFVFQVERYSAEVLGSRSHVWDATKSHPPQWIRWSRMLAKVEEKLPEDVRKFIYPQIGTITRSLEAYYAGAVTAVTKEVKQTEAALEWRLQRHALERITSHRLVPPHLFIAMRCARAALDAGRLLENSSIMKCAEAADAELEAAGARPLCDYSSPLTAVVQELSEHALSDTRATDPKTVREWVDRLADVFRLDARTRYPRQ